MCSKYYTFDRCWIDFLMLVGEEGHLERSVLNLYGIDIAIELLMNKLGW